MHNNSIAERHESICLIPCRIDGEHFGFGKSLLTMNTCRFRDLLDDPLRRQTLRCCFRFDANH